MSTPSRTRWLAVSVTAHAAVCALLAALPAPPAERPRFDDVETTELAVEPPPAPPPPAEPPAPAATPAEPPQPAARLARVAPRPPARPPPFATTPAPATPPPVAPPPPAPPLPPPPVLRAADLLRAAGASTELPVGVRATPAPDATAADRGALFPAPEGTALDRARAASQGYVRDALAASTAREAPGVRGYLWNVRRRVSEQWRPGVVRVPGLAETLLAGLAAPERALRAFGERMIRRQRQALEAPPERLGGAADAIEAIGGVAGNGPGRRQNVPANASEESWRRNARTTRAEVEVDQDAGGRVLDVRVLHGSGIAAFDRAALDAVRAGVAEQDPVPLPGGRRSRWSFVVVATRRLLAPSIGGSFDESRGWFRVELPGQVMLRSRVTMESSAPLEAPAPRP